MAEELPDPARDDAEQPPSHLDDPFDTAVELEQEAEALEEAASAARGEALAEFADAKSALLSAENTYSAEAAKARAALETYEQQAVDSDAVAARRRAEAAEFREQAASARDRGDLSAAHSAEENARGSDVAAEVRERVAANARQFASDARTALEDAELGAGELGRQSAEASQRMQHAEDIADNQEAVAAAARRAADELDAADVLELQLAGVDGTDDAEADRLRAAIAAHRASAVEIREEAGLVVRPSGVELDSGEPDPIDPYPVDPINPDPINPDPINPDPINPDPIDPVPVVPAPNGAPPAASESGDLDGGATPEPWLDESTPSAAEETAPIEFEFDEPSAGETFTQDLEAIDDAAEVLDDLTEL